jgi:hypothetical protein
MIDGYVAEIWQQRTFHMHANYAFNDIQAVMALVGAECMDEVEAVIEAQRMAMTVSGDNATSTREVDYPVVLAVQAFGQGDYNDTVCRSRAVRELSYRFGGSHA